MPENASLNSIAVDELMQPAAFPHNVQDIELLETHISWVILTGEWAYKIKKPVQFEFVDYSNSSSIGGTHRKSMLMLCRSCGILPVTFAVARAGLWPMMPGSSNTRSR